MKTKEFFLPTETASQQLATHFATLLVPGTVIAFSGEIGSGKTTFIRAILRAFGVTGAIKSPSFSLVETYECDDLNIHHFDFYRIQSDQELADMGFREYIHSDAICCIEWPELVKNAMLVVDLHFSLSMQGSGRLMSIRADSAHGEIILQKIK